MGQGAKAAFKVQGRKESEADKGIDTGVSECQWCDVIYGAIYMMKLLIPDTNTQIAAGVISRRWPVTIKNYWFGQRPELYAMPDIARLHSLPYPVAGARNKEAWTLLNDLSGTDTDIMAQLSKDTRKQIRRAEREGITSERLDPRYPSVLNEFALFWGQFVESKKEVRTVLDVSVQLHMLQRMAKASILEVSRAVSYDGTPIVYHVLIVSGYRARVHHSASLFRESQHSSQRHYLGWANRLLHYNNMHYYQQKGYKQYDFGGWYAGKDNESLLRINQFKEEFGGKVNREYDVMLGCSLLGQLVLKIYNWLRKM